MEDIIKEADGLMESFWTQMDTNGDGFFDRSELEKILQAQRDTLLKAGITDLKEIESMKEDFEAQDANKDGKVSKDEMKAFMLKLIQEYYKLSLIHI